jgi:hypothetical protein
LYIILVDCSSLLPGKKMYGIHADVLVISYILSAAADGGTQGRFFWPVFYLN